MSALLIVIASFLANSMTTILLVYAVVVIGVVVSRVVTNHLKFVCIVALPLLVALLFVWGWVMDPHQIPAPHQTGVAYALFLWLRVISFGGALQILFLPLLAKPSYLRDFLSRSGLSGSIGTLILAAIVFLPEVRRRLDRIVDARKAQGHSVSGLSGLFALPAMLMPLIASLLDSATKRAELWSHRGVLEREIPRDSGMAYSYFKGSCVLLLSLATCGAALFI